MEFFVEALIGCIITLIGFWFMSDIIFQKKSDKSFLSFLIIIFYSIIISMLNILIKNGLDKVIKIIIFFIMMIIFNKYKYNKKISDIIIGTFIVYVNYFIAEVGIVSTLSIVYKIFGLNLFELFKYSLVANIITSTISIIIIIILKNLYIKIFKRILYTDSKTVISTLLVLIILAILLTRESIDKLQFNFDFLLTMTLILIFCFIGIYMIKQKAEIDKVTDKYTKLAEYAKNNEGLLEEYRMNLHENKNRLIAIDNMVPAKYKEIHEYIGELIEKNKSSKYYWLTELKYVPSPELKGFMNYKIMEMIDSKLEVEVNISRELDKKVIKNYNVKDKEELYSIVGIFLDNAHEAAKVSKEKAVSIQMFMEKKDCKLIIANTYKGKIELDKIDEYGYSSKGANRGTGLHIVSEIVNRNPLFEKETSILDNYFVQTLIIHPKQLKKKKS